MNEQIHLSIATATALSATSVRGGETKLGEGIRLLSTSDTSRLSEALSAAFAQGARYAILGVPEDIGPRANLGRAGADKAFAAFLQFFVNMQANRFVDPGQFLLVGQVDLADLSEKEKQLAGADQVTAVSDLRELCAEIDERVCAIVSLIATAGLEPIVIGGGNNNSFPTIKGVVTALRQKENAPDLKIATVNCDPHADFRIIEGRHSGNPFSYADKEGLLGGYCVLGAHENFNSEDMLARLEQRSYPLFYFDDVVRQECTWEEQVERVLGYLASAGKTTGLELDLDGIKNMPSSARTPFGISEEQAFYFIYRVASRLDTKYLHLSEAAPAYAEDGNRTVGKVLAKAVIEYARARQKYRSALAEAAGALSANS